MQYLRKQRLSQIVVLYLIAALFSGCASIKKEFEQEAFSEPAKPRLVSIVAVGDIMLGGKGRPRFEREGYKFPFVATRELLQSADIAIGNLETSLTTTRQSYVDKKYRFRNAPDKVAAALKWVGFDIVSLANNHSMDYGEEGLSDTLDALNKVGIRHHGAGKNLLEARKAQIFTLGNGLKVGFLAYSNTFPEEFWAKENRPGTAFGHEKYVRSDVAALKEQAIDIIVVSFHWGRERETELRGYQPLLAHAAIDAGADLVIGHHPHILQAVEQYKDGLILYSLGNYTFSTFSQRVHTAAVARVSFAEGEFTGLKITPININNFKVQLQPQILTGKDAQKVFDELSPLSAKRSTQLKLLNDIIVLHPEGADQ